MNTSGGKDGLVRFGFAKGLFLPRRYAKAVGYHPTYRGIGVFRHERNLVFIAVRFAIAITQGFRFGVGIEPDQGDCRKWLGRVRVRC